jgi:hypothetical protein
MDASACAFVHGVGSTRSTLAAWNREPWPVLRSWLAGSLPAAVLLLLTVWLVAALTPGSVVGRSEASIRRPIASAPKAPPEPTTPEPLGRRMDAPDRRLDKFLVAAKLIIVSTH